MSSASQIIAEELDNLALLLVMGDEKDENSYAEASTILENINNALAKSTLDSDFKNQMLKLISDTNNSTNSEKYDSLKKLTSLGQALMNGQDISASSDDEEDNSDLPVISKSEIIKQEPTQAERMSLMLDAFYENHKSFMQEIFEKFVELKNTGHAQKEMPNELHQDVESYVLRLNQDATKLGAKPLIDIAQQLFMLLMQYPLVDIKDELKVVGDFILESISKAKESGDIESISVPESITSALNLIEDKLSGKTDSKPSDVNLERTSTVSSEHQSESSQVLGTYTIDADSEILSEFIAEATDHLNAVEGILLERELDFSPDDVDTLFRGVHSLKGTSSYFNLLEINESSHLLENILDEVRTGTRKLDQKLKSLVLRYVDIQTTLLKSAQQAVQKGGLVERSLTVKTFIKDIEDFFNLKDGDIEELEMETTQLESMNHTEQTQEQANSFVPVEVEKRNNEPAVQAETVNKTPQASKESSLTKSFVKIDTERLDSLGEMIGEMVIYSSMLIRKCRELLPNDESTMRMSDQVEKFSRELQDIGMSMRLDPIRGLFQKLSRLVWDTSKKLGKEIKFVVKGEDTELDRNVIERLADPLMHMVRNSLDHGIEDPTTREALGKDRTGIIELSSSHEGGSIVIKIRDDGRGLDPKKLLTKAIEKGIVSKEANLTEQEIFQLIFAPGFSTAEKVTDISGRGVGMDVVRTNIESMRGRINIESKVGEGSTFSIELPLTLAIIEGIEAGVGREKFIFPMLSVVELVRPTLNMIGSSMHADETFFFRGKHLPMFRLSNILAVPSTTKCPTDGGVIILNNGGELVALLVDEIGGNCQTVIKSLGPLFEKQSGIAGCAIVNNGDIGLIIDVRSLIQVAKADSKGKQTTRANVACTAEKGLN